MFSGVLKLNSKTSSVYNPVFVYRVDQNLACGCKFRIVYMCQKLSWNLASSRQSYCKNLQASFFGPPCI